MEDGKVKCLLPPEVISSIESTIPGYPQPIPRRLQTAPNYRIDKNNKGLAGLYATKRFVPGDLIFAERPLAIIPRTDVFEWHMPPVDRKDRKQQQFLSMFGVNPASVGNKRRLPPPGDAKQLLSVLSSDEDRAVLMGLRPDVKAWRADAMTQARTVLTENVFIMPESALFEDRPVPIRGLPPLAHEGLRKVSAKDSFALLGVHLPDELDDPENDGVPRCHLLAKDGYRLNHSCVPNVRVFYDPASMSLQYRATREIRANEELTIHYVPSMRFRGFFGRQSFILWRYDIACQCTMCKQGQEGDLFAKLDKLLRPDLHTRLEKVKAYQPFEWTDIVDWAQGTVAELPERYSLTNLEKVLKMFTAEGLPDDILNICSVLFLLSIVIGDETRTKKYGEMQKRYSLAAHGTDKYIMARKVLDEESLRRSFDFHKMWSSKPRVPGQEIEKKSFAGIGTWLASEWGWDINKNT
jgi:hypothetical protein